MTVPIETYRLTYTGTGAVSVYAYTFRILDSSHLTLTVVDTDGVETTLTSDQYDVDGVGEIGGGNVTLDTPLASGYTLVIERDPPLVQETDFDSFGTFLPETHEDAIDMTVMQIQHTAGEIERALRLTTGSEDGSGEYDANGNKIGDLADPTDSQDAATKNYVDAVISGSLAVAVYTTATRPTAGEDYSGFIIRVKDTDVPETLQVCMRKGDGTWEWVTIGVAGF